MRKIADANPGSKYAGWGSSLDYHADVSPDGSQLVYATCEYTAYNPRLIDGGRDRGNEIATVNVDGTGRRRLTRNASFENYPVWSPSGDRVAFIANYPVSIGYHRESGYYEPSEARIFTMAADGTDMKVVPNTEEVSQYPPVWSPDGERLAFAVYGEWYQGEGYFRLILYTVRLDGSELSRIGEATSIPTWSPDGERLAFGFDDGNEIGVYSVRFDGGGARLVASQRVSLQELPAGYRSPLRVRQVSWSPDGSRLLVVSDRVVTVRPDGSDLLELVPTNLDDGRKSPFVNDAIWSSDGSMIAVRQWNESDSVGVYDISVMTADGGEATVVASTAELGLTRSGDSPTSPDYFPGYYEHIIWASKAPPLTIADCSAGVVVPTPESNPGMVEDCETLIRAIPRFVELPTLVWNAYTPVSEWSRVTVGGNPPRVRELMLRKSGLAGTIPPEFGNLTGLRELELAYNNFTGPIPPELGNLTMLRILNLDFNNLSGPIPQALGSLTMLRVLSLPENNLSGPIPSALGNLSMLKVLDIRHNDLSGQIPSELGKLAGLEELNLAYNNLTGPIPPELGQLTMLKKLGSFGNDLSGCIPIEFPKPELWIIGTGLKRCEQ